MRLASGLFVGALSLPAMLFACSSFSAADDLDAGAEAGTPLEAAAGQDGESANAIIVSGQTGATEIVANDSVVVWNTGGNILRAAKPVANAAANDLTYRLEDLPKSLQLVSDKVAFGMKDTMWTAGVDGSQLTAGPTSISPRDGEAILATRYLSTEIVFAKNTRVFWCLGGSCGDKAVTPPLERQVDVGVSLLGPDVDESHVWAALGDRLRSLDTTTFSNGVDFQIDGGVQAFAVDQINVYYAIKGSNIVAFREKTKDSAPTTLLALADPSQRPYAIGIDDTNVYVAVINGGTVLAVDKTSRAVKTLASGLPSPVSLAVTGANVLVLAGGSIYALPK